MGIILVMKALLQGGKNEVAREEMLAYWESKGKLKTDERQITATGKGARYVVTSGKDGYVVGAGFRQRSGLTGQTTVELRANSVVKETIMGSTQALILLEFLRM